MSRASIDFFDRQFRRQAAERDLALNPFEILALEHLGGRVLDLGCGLGNLALEAARRGHPVTAVDASPTAVGHVRAEARREGLTVRAVEADVATYDLAEEYDTIACIGLLMLVERPRAQELLREIRARVAPGGRAIVNVLIEGTTYRAMLDPDRHCLFAADELEAAFAGWRVLVARRDEFPAPGGTRKVFATVVAERPSAPARDEARAPAAARDRLPTEARNPASAGLDRLPLEDAFDVFQREDERMVAAVGRARAEVCAAIALVRERLARGGRLVYAGAGTSGRLGALDAAECPPTFLVEPERVVALVAGGAAALTGPVEGAEDDAPAARRAVDRLAVGPPDVVLGITAGGTTPFVHAALARARERGAATIFLACVPPELVPDAADLSIRLDVGPEVLAGSTRLKAGSATKLVLNRVTTLAFAGLGRVHGNLMVDVDASANAKLAQRATAITRELTGLPEPAARALLERAGLRAKTAAVMHARGVDRAEAERLLAAADGVLARVLAEPPAP